ncbi:MAG: hypothetical protein LC679_17975 [Intrasporangiaceae bacterium]|nr:hypothetical protein [Intrasporangiaceae bacterium]
MGVLFLDPLALGLLLGLSVYVWLVWRGSYTRWFGRPDAWTIVAWPIPLLAIGVPPAAGSLVWLADRLGADIGTGGIADAAVYAVAYGLPAVYLTVWPPRWLLPGWARDRIAQLPAAGTGSQVPRCAIPAVQGARGHASRARWAWRVDGVAGQVWIDGAQLRFRAATGPDPEATADLGIDDGALAELRLTVDGDALRLENPRGGWWRRGHLDVALTDLDRVRVRSTVPWRRDGLIAFEVEGRRPSQLWVADVRDLQSRLAADGGPVE